MTGLWYVLGLAAAGVGFVFLVIGLAWVISHRNRGDRHKGLPFVRISLNSPAWSG